MSNKKDRNNNNQKKNLEIVENIPKTNRKNKL